MQTAIPSTAISWSRFCSADVPVVSATFNSKTLRGSSERIHFTGTVRHFDRQGEEVTDGRAFATVITGPEAGNAYLLPQMGRLAWENILVCPYESDLTIVAGTDDNSNGIVVFYVGHKLAGGNVAEEVH